MLSGKRLIFCPIDAGQEVIIVIGENLVKEKIESQLNFLPDN